MVGQINKRKMKTLKTIAVALISLSVLSCSSSKNTTSAEVEESISQSVDEAISDLEDAPIVTENVNAEKFKTLIESGKGLLIDVRTPNEVAQGKIEGATNLDFYSSTFKDDLSKLDKSKAIYVYCRSGGRSGKAMSQMKELGFTEVYNLLGGYSKWPYK